MKNKFGTGILVFVLCFGYLFLKNKIPDEVSVRPGETLQLHTGIPLSMEQKEEEPVTLASMVFGRSGLGNSQKTGSYTLSCRLFGVIPIKDIYVQERGEKYLIPGGMPVGIYVKTKGILVIGTSPVNGMSGETVEPAKYLLKSGDYICSVNGEKVSTKEELLDRVHEYGDQPMAFGIERNGERIEVAMEAVMTQEKAYKIGVWVRDDLAGAGTLTYTDTAGNYGALGHGVSDADTSTLIDMEKGLLYQTDIIGIIKGKRGTPGELTGIINYSSRYCLGDVKKNTKAGVYGKLDGIPEELTSEQQIPVGFKQEVQLGKAEIICTLEGERKSYDIEITQTNFNARETNKGIRFVVKDQELCALTGGIVQGMSGSPIVQNGKIIGAVTHVFVQDASKGYGIFIEEMLEQG